MNITEKYIDLIKKLNNRFELEEKKISANECDSESLEVFLKDIIEITSKTEEFFSALDFNQENIDDVSKLKTLTYAMMNQSAEIFYLIFNKNVSKLDDESYARKFKDSVMNNIGKLIISNMNDMNILERDVIIHLRSIIENVQQGVIVYD